LKILFDEISDRKIHYEFFQPEWLDISDLGLNSPVEVKIALRKVDEKTVKLTGSVRSTALFSCDRCLEEYPHSLKAEFTYSFKHGEDDLLDQEEVECDEEDCNTVYVKAPAIIVGDVLREQLVLAVPESRICRKNCQGLCSGCGTDLNRSYCVCSSENVSSPFAVLKKLKK
jgi:uncharacterized protein